MAAPIVRLGPATPPSLPADYAQRSGRFHDWECQSCHTFNAVYLVACRVCAETGRVVCRWNGCSKVFARNELAIHMSVAHSRPQAEGQRYERSDTKQFRCAWEDERANESCKRMFIKEAELESHFAAHSHVPGLFCPSCPPYYFLNEEDHRRNHTDVCDPWLVQGPRPIHRRRHRSHSHNRATVPVATPPAGAARAALADAAPHLLHHKIDLVSHLDHTLSHSFDGDVSSLTNWANAQPRTISAPPLPPSFTQFNNAGSDDQLLPSISMLNRELATGSSQGFHVDPSAPYNLPATMPFVAPPPLNAAAFMYETSGYSHGGRGATMDVNSAKLTPTAASFLALNPLSFAPVPTPTPVSWPWNNHTHTPPSGTLLPTTLLSSTSSGLPMALPRASSADSMHASSRKVDSGQQATFSPAWTPSASSLPALRPLDYMTPAVRPAKMTRPPSDTAPSDVAELLLSMQHSSTNGNGVPGHHHPFMLHASPAMSAPHDLLLQHSSSLATTTPPPSAPRGQRRKRSTC